MAQTKIYPSTQAQVAAIDAKLDVIDGKITEPSLADVSVGIADFVHGDITIMSGGLESTSRRITT